MNPYEALEALVRLTHDINDKRMLPWALRMDERPDPVAEAWVSCNDAFHMRCVIRALRRNDQLSSALYCGACWPTALFPHCLGCIALLRASVPMSVRYVVDAVCAGHNQP